MAKYIGIDFGMQNLKVCYFDGTKNYKVDLEGNQQSSSKVSRNVVFYEENEEQILKKYFFSSQEAEEARIWLHPDYIRYIKRELQKENYFRSVCSGKYVFSALQIITDIFSQVFLKMNESRYDITAPVILTVPVIFSEAQKEMLKFCAEKAGFQVSEIITEPFAVLFSEEIFDECVDEVEDEDFVLIFDFGASTLDICLIRITNDDDLSVETLSSTGLSFGGKDITDAITDFLMDKYSDVIDSVIKEGRLDEFAKVVTVFEKAEELKNQLYAEEDTPEAETKDLFYGYKKMILKRTNVDKILDSMGIWNKIEQAIEDMFDSTDEFDSDDFDIVSKIVMTGGTSKIQYFRDKLENLFGETELIGDSEEDDVIYCSVSSGAVNFARQDNINIKNSSPMNIGIEIGHGFEKALNRNSVYNVCGKRKYISLRWLAENNWKIKVYQTLKSVREHSDINNEDILYAGYIQLNKDLYRTEEDDIVIQLKFTRQGVVAITASAVDVQNIIENKIILKSEVKYE
ncbi:MAG: Hsp70 family protein [Ruminococcus sp.]|nr:Hsp70 family protein [Ruminococcus sp.]